MTRRLFYEDAYIDAFDAVVTGCEMVVDAWSVTLDRTAFYPEGGGQPGDTGALGGVRVCDTQDGPDGEIRHITDGPLAVGTAVHGQIDWPVRFSHMQHHTGEHILSGLLHSLYGVDNVGFHMGRDAVTIDLSRELSWDELLHAERLANETVWRDVPVRIEYPDAGALAALAYRSKKALSGAVRIVTVPGADVCACCGTHTARTGAVGMIKLLSAQRYKGGTRVWLCCGGRALKDYEAKNASVHAISALLSAKPGEVAGAAARMQRENEALRQRLSALRRQLFAYRAKEVEQGARCAVLFEEAMEPVDLRHLCMALTSRCGVAAVLAGGEGDRWSYAVGSEQTDVRPLGAALNETFDGCGGGKPGLVQGTLTGAREQLSHFFETYLF